ASACGRKGLFNFIDPQDERRHPLREVERFAEALFRLTDKLVVECAGVEPGEFESPFAGDGARGKAFAAPLHAGNKNTFGRNESEAPAFGSERASAVADPITQASETGDVAEGGRPADSFEQARASQAFPFRFENRIE